MPPMIETHQASTCPDLEFGCAFEPGDALTFPKVAEIVSVFTRPGCDGGRLGDGIRSACLRYALHRKLLRDPSVLLHIAGWMGWIDANVVRVESVESVHLHHEFGYVSQVDLVAELNGIGWTVIDVETQQFNRSRDGTAFFCPTWPLRLSAAQQAILSSSARNVSALVSVVIDCDRPGRIHVRRWNCGQDEPDHFRTFLAAFAVWKYLNHYNPGPRVYL